MGKNRKKPTRRKGQKNRHSLASVNTGPTMKSMSAANPILLAEYSARGRNLGRDMSYLDAKFPGAGGEGKNVPRLLALRKRAEEIAREAGGTPDKFLNVYNDKLSRLTLFFNAEHTRYFFVKEEYLLGLTQKSFSYSTLAKAKQALNAEPPNGIGWFPPEIVSSS